ncbi:MAG: AAA family ATPase [Actinomycetota bacterium]|nr:AAA family ATPase [Actinomycetota bacterium]
MYLKSLTLRGFKSFADKTLFKFEPGVTIIVGPNGSGKSNITDAILWVLGEQNPRALRGSSMEDIIFAGSRLRPALGLAEVSLYLDNSDGFLPVEFSEVVITRRILRSGESEYLINDSPCRLVDIQDLLSESGLNKDCSIVGQGKLEEILTSKSDERRILLEEAAGVLRHKKRKERALRKLVSMDHNLVRIKDVLQEVNRQLKPLKVQANRAQTHEKLSKQLRDLEVELCIMKLQELQSKWNDLKIKKENFSSKIDALREELTSEKRKLEWLHNSLEEKGIQVSDIGEQRRHLQGIYERLNSRLLLLEEKGKNLIERLSEFRQKIHQLEKRKDQREREIAQLKEERFVTDTELKRIHTYLSELHQRMETLGTNRKKIEEKIEQIEQAIYSKQSKLAQKKRIWEEEATWIALERTLAKVLSSLRKQAKKLALCQQNLLDLSQKLEGRGSLRDLTQLCQDVKAKLEKIQDEQETIQENFLKVLENLPRRATAIGDKPQKKLKDEIASLEEEITILDYKMQVLEKEKGLSSEEGDKIRKEITQCQAELASLEERRVYTEKQLVTAKRELNEVEDLLKSEYGIARSLEHLRTRIQPLHNLFCQLVSEIEQWDSKLENIATDEENVSRGIRKSIKESQTKAGFLDGQIEQLRENVHHLEVSQAQLELEVKTLVEKIVREYGVSLEKALKDSPRGSKRTYEFQIQKLKEEIAKLGPVNPIALKDFAALEERQKFLNTQINDLLESKRALGKVIRAIDKKIEDRILETFEEVNLNFQSIFSYLFPGGKGELTLTDRDDVLNTGIDIEAQPGGKRLQKLSLLSGGETALVALAFLFAIYHTHPSPFYVLDEVEATLDDVNLQRFIALVSKLRGKVQFLIITHQGRTMEIADAIYGVSMQADGISKLISQKFKPEEEVAYEKAGRT